MASKKKSINKSHVKKTTDKSSQKAVAKKKIISKIKKIEAVHPSILSIKNKSAKTSIKSKKKPTAGKITEELENVESVPAEETITITNPDAITLNLPATQQEPLGVKIIYLLEIIWGIGAIVAGITLLIIKPITVKWSIIAILIGFFFIFIASNLLNGKKWTRTFQIIIYAVILGLTAYGMSAKKTYFSGFIENDTNLLLYNSSVIAISLVIVIYLIFSKRVKEYFQD